MRRDLTTRSIILEMRDKVIGIEGLRQERTSEGDTVG